MSKLIKYIDSLNKFMKRYNHEISIKDNYLPILFLTLLNYQNKKNKFTFNFYYSATAIYLLSQKTHNISLIIQLFNQNIINLHSSILSKEIILRISIKVFELLCLFLNNKIDITYMAIKLIMLFSCNFNEDKLIVEISDRYNQLCYYLNKSIINKNDFEIYNKNKEEIISIFTYNDLFSDTLKEIIDKIDENIENKLN